MTGNNILTKENSLILRGLGIVAIMMHNFLHNPKLGFSQENEMSFVKSNVEHFFGVVANGQNEIYEVLSFLGWTGVFVFLTGYGVFQRCPIPNLSRESFIYIKRQYVKLLMLLLPAITIFAVGDLMQNQFFPEIFKRVSYLAMMANFAYPWVKCVPGVYWYFGLTFQFYLIYAFFGKYVSKANLILVSVLTLAGLGVLCYIDMPDALSVYRHCFTGWFVIFAIGAWLAKWREKSVLTKDYSILLVSLILVLSAFGVFIMNMWMITWLFVPIVALVMFITAGMLIQKSVVLSGIFKYIGRLSACIFVCHPIIRFIINHYMLSRTDNMLLIVGVYFVATLLVAMIYDVLYKKALLITNK